MYPHSALGPRVKHGDDEGERLSPPYFVRKLSMKATRFSMSELDRMNLVMGKCGLLRKTAMRAWV